MTISDEIELAFSWRSKPDVLVSKTTKSNTEIAEVEHFSRMTWHEITCDDLKSNRDAIHHFSSEAFCYFLPGIMQAGINCYNRDLLVYDSLIAVLDRSPGHENWDSHFESRWTLLTIQECTAVQSWIVWLSDGLDCHYSNTYDRCLDTLELLKAKKS